VYLIRIGFVLLWATALQAQEVKQPEETLFISKNTSVQSSGFMVAAAHPAAARAGRDILAAGGSAADAAVAVQFMLNLVEPQSSGIGGGAFALYWDASDNRLSSWDGRETAPRAATPDYWIGPDGQPVGWFRAVVGGRSVGVPGTLLLLDNLQAKFGLLKWADLLAPTIDAAEKGFMVSPRMAGSIAGAKNYGLTNYAAARTYFFDEDGAPLPTGHLLKNPKFAALLRRIARERSTPFYHGDIARDIVAATRTPTNPGILTAQDFADYRVISRAPVCADYRGYNVCGMGPPSSGGLTVGQTLKLLERFDIAAMGPTASAYHLFAEASKLAFADRNLYMADSDFVDMPSKGLLDGDYLRARAALIDPAKAMGKADAGNPPWDETRLFAPQQQVERAGTSHFVIVDQFGDMISMTTTIETGFGSRVMSHGFILNNELTDFSRTPQIDGLDVANRVEGGKRPRSSMAPTIVLKDGAPVLLIGSPGGSRIISYVAQAIIAILDWNMDPQMALDLGHVVNRNGATDLEEDTDAAGLAPVLQALGHDTKIRNMNSGLHAIVIRGDQLIGAADKRREGVVLGN